MTCPDCERHKLSAALWRHKAYELNGTPLPWSAEELIKDGWLCPACGRGNAPMNMTCPCKPWTTMEVSC